MVGNDSKLLGFKDSAGNVPNLDDCVFYRASWGGHRIGYVDHMAYRQGVWQIGVRNTEERDNNQRWGCNFVTKADFKSSIIVNKYNKWQYSNL